MALDQSLERQKLASSTLSEMAGAMNSARWKKTLPRDQTMANYFLVYAVRLCRPAPAWLFKEKCGMG